MNEDERLNIEFVNKVLGLGAKHGLRKLSLMPGGGLIVEYEGKLPPDPHALSDVLPRHLDLGAPELCPCSHDETEHSGGLCLLGCNAETCSPPKSDAQKATDAP